MSFIALPSLPASDRTITGKPGIRVVIFGSSTDEQNYLTFAADLSTNASKVTTITTFALPNDVTPCEHLLGSGVFVLLGTPRAVAGSYIAQRAFGWARKKTTTSLELDTPDWATGSSPVTPDLHTGKIHVMNSFGPQSWFRAVYDRFNGAVELLTTYALGGETTDIKKLYFADEVLPLNPDVIWGSFGIGNDVLGKVQPNDTATRVWTMIQSAINAGIVCIVNLPPATVGMDAGMTTRGLYIRDALDQKRRTHVKGNLVLFSDDFPGTIEPVTGGGNPSLFRDTVHAAQKQAIINGLRGSEVIRALVSAAPDQRIASILDRKRALPARGTRQLMDGVWSGTGVAASTVATSPAHVSGSVDKGLRSIVTGGTITSPMVCSLFARSDGYFDEVFSFQGATDSTLKLIWKNEVGFEFYRYLLDGSLYDACCGFSLALTGGAKIARYDHYIEIAQSKNSVNVGGRVSEHMRFTNAPGVFPTNVSSTEPAQDFDVSYDPAMFPPFKATGVATDAAWVLDLKLAAGGTVTIRRWRPTIRERITADLAAYMALNDLPEG